MPRGLGEDPLSRKRRARASRTGSAVPDGAAAGSVLPPAQPPFQGSTASSYNEVFFHRRESQGEGPSIPSVPANTASDAVESFAPQEPAIVPAAVNLQQTASTELGSVSPTEATVEASTPSLAVEAPPPAVEPEQVEAGVRQEQSSAQPAAEKRGFLSRFFGKLRN